ncbi:MAG: MMPL family transporter [Pseudomonadota bacterium]
MAVLAGVTAYFSMALPRLEVKAIYSDLLPSDHEYVRVFKDHPNFGNPLTVAVMLKRTDGGTIYNVETLGKIFRLTREIDLAPGVDHDLIMSIASEKARYLQATPGGVDSEPVMGNYPPANDQEVAEIRSHVDKSYNTSGFMISPDETALLLTATFIEQRLDYRDAFNFVRDMAARERDANHDIYVAGQPILTGWIYQYEAQVLYIFAATIAALIIALVLYMRNIPGVVTPLVCSLVAAIWGFGFVSYIHDPIEPLLMVVPMLLVARSFSHCVQFTERYYELLHRLGDKRRAAEAAFTYMVAPGTLGIITDATGLFLIAITPIPMMERLALFCGFWALIMIPTNVLLPPLLLSVLPEPKNVSAIINADHNAVGMYAMIRRFLAFVASLSFGARGKATTVVLLVVIAGSLYQSLNIKVGNPVEGSGLLWEDSDFNVAVGAINRHFVGTNSLEIILEAKDPENIDERTARHFDTLKTQIELQRFLESQPSPPTATLALHDYVPEANRLFSGGNPKWAPMDFNFGGSQRATIALTMGNTNVKALMHVTNFTHQHTTVKAFYKDNKQETVDIALDNARRAVASVGTDHERFTVRLGTGTIALQQSVNDTVQFYQHRLLLLLNLVILVTCSIAYRSIAAGLLLLVPVNLSNLLVVAVMASMGVGLDVNTLPISAIGIGVGIDYGIYLLSRICEEHQVHKDYPAAIEAALSTTGQAIFFTATIVLIGILPWYFLSDLKFLAATGLLLVIVMLINMVVALIVLPLTVWLFKPKFIAREQLLTRGKTAGENA